MTELTEVSEWDAGVYSFLTTDPVQGGPGGIDNEPHQNLVNRVLWLRNRIAAAIIQSGQADDSSDNQQLVEAVVLQVASVPALRLVPVPLVPGTQPVLVLTRGQNADSDGLAATYRWNATSTLADDGASVVSPSPAPVNGRWTLCGINASALGGQSASYYATAAAVAAAVALLAPRQSPPLTGTPTTPTPAAGDSSATIPNTQWVANGFVPHTGIGLAWSGNPGTYYKLATLPASTVGTADSIHIKATLNVGYLAAADTMLDGIFGNRNGFSYVYNLFGPNDPSTAIQCFAETDGTVSVYAVCTATFGFATVTILNSGVNGITGPPAVLYPTPAATTTPTGTLCFNSAAPLTYPPFLNVSSPLSYLTPTVAAATYLPIAGGALYGNLTIAGADLNLYRSGGTTGCIYFNLSKSAYLFYDGTNFDFSAPGGTLYVNGYPMARITDYQAGDTNTLAAANANTAAALANYLPLSGGTLTGPLTLAGGDLKAYRVGGATGVVFLDSPGSHYLYWDGTQYNLPGGEVFANGYQLARLNSPAFQNTPTAPTPATTDSSQTLATTAFVHALLATVPAIKSGTFSCINGTVAVSFGYTFASAPRVFVQWNYASPDTGYVVANSITTTGFQYKNANAGVCDWLATTA